MSLLRMLTAAAVAGTGGPPDPPDPPADTRPYAFPTSAPWNAPVPAITPAPDGTNSCMHPSVVDFGDTPWNGSRYWMATTAYHNSVEAKENPCIHRSADGYTWTVPPGLTNPIDPQPAAANHYNSDTELVYDPDTDRLVCYWREFAEAEGWSAIYASTSSNGSSWSAPAEQVALSAVGASGLLSPTVLRVGAGDWRMWCTGNVRTAPSPLGPWSAPTSTPYGVSGVWHISMTYWGGRFRAVLNIREPAWVLVAATSTDGITWTPAAGPFLSNTAGWDNVTLYRSCGVAAPDGANVNLWYSSNSTTTSWRVGYTQVPRSLWPA